MAEDQQRQSWRLIDVLSWATTWFESKNIPHARRDAEQLLAPILGCKRIELYMYYDRLLSEEERATYKNYITQRASRIPLAYIVGDTEFYGYEFKVGTGVLIPRPETEVLVEKALATNPAKHARILDVGTGSGNIACTVALERDDISVTALEASPEAYIWAEKNISLHHLETRVQLTLMDFIEESREDLIETPYDIILANPPYIARDEIKNLEDEVKSHEPHMALIGGERGDELPIEQLIAIAECIKNDGHLFMEIGADQGKRMKDIADELFPTAKVDIILDLAERDRILHIEGPWRG